MINKIQNQNNLIKSQYNKNIDRTLEFNKILRGIQDIRELKISSHAADRLKERNITLDEKDMNNLNSAVSKLRDKGGREALILYNNIAFITSVKNNTIITAVDSEKLKENVFTNIDSAMII